MNASFLGRLLGIKGAGHPEGPNPVPRTKLNPGKTETFLYAQVVLGLLDIYHQSKKIPPAEAIPLELLWGFWLLHENSEQFDGFCAEAFFSVLKREAR